MSRSDLEKRKSETCFCPKHLIFFLGWGSSVYGEAFIVYCRMRLMSSVVADDYGTLPGWWRVATGLLDGRPFRFHPHAGVRDCEQLRVL